MSGAALSVPRFFIEGDPNHMEVVTDSTPGTLQTFVFPIVPANFRRDIWQVSVSCKFTGDFYIYVDATTIGSGHTGAGIPSPSTFNWTPPQQGNAGQTITITFQQRDHSPSVPLEIYLMCADVQLSV